MTQDYKIVDLFSGVGGFSLGFEKPERLNGLGELGYDGLGFEDKGFKTILAVDSDEAAAEGFRKNFDAKVIEGDIHDIESFQEWSDAQVVIGGPPCQGFSSLTKKKLEDVDDERNKLWEEFLRAVEDINPDVFLLENVPRFLKSEEGKKMVKKAKNMGYEVVVDQLWAHRYGVPQKRRRAIVIGSKIGTPFLPAKTSEEIKNVEDAIGDLPLKPTGENWHEGRNVAEITEKRMKHIPKGGNRKDIPEEFLPDCWKNYESGGNDLYGRLWYDKPSNTIRTNFYKPMTGRHLHPEANRSITIREGARLQTFPDDFEFGKNDSKTRVARQIGNAVPPKMAYHIAQSVMAHFEGLEGKIIEEAKTPHEIMTKTKNISITSLKSIKTR